MPSKGIPILCQCRAMGSIWSVRSRKVQPVNSPVWVEKRAVGIQAHSTPVAETTGSATVSEHFPKPEMSCTAAILLSFGSTFSISDIVAPFHGTCNALAGRTPVFLFFPVRLLRLFRDG